MTKTVHYTYRKNNANTSTTVSVTQTKPLTRRTARRAAIDALWESIEPSRQYQRLRITSIV
jgi:hypothetical protein